MVYWNPAWANAIANIESRGSGGYDAIGPKTKKGNRAYGKYQVMDFNIPSWTKKHLGKSLTPAEFLANPKVQDAVFKGEFGNYVRRYGNPQDAASMWFTGKPLKAGAGNKDILGTTGQGYVSKFNKELGGTDMAQAQVNPNIISSLFGGGNTSEPFAAPEPQGILERFGLQKMVEGAEGETGRKFYNRDSFLDLVSRFGAVASDNPVAQQMALDGIDRRADRKKSNKTAEYLNSIGQTDLANAIGQGLISGPEAMDRLFSLNDAERLASLEQYRYDRGLADQRLDTQTGYERDDEVAKRERNQKLADLATDREFQVKLLGIRQGNQEDLVRLRDELSNDPNSFANQILLEQLELREIELADKLASNAGKREQTAVQTEGMEIENQIAQAELDKVNNPPPPVESTVEGPIVDPINIDTAAAGDPFGVGQRLLDVVRTNIFGGKGSSLVGEQSNLNAIDQLVRAGLSRNISDRGSVYSSEMLDKLLPSVGDADAKMESKITRLIPILQQQLDLASDVVTNDVGSASQKGAARQVLAAFPDLIEALKLSQGTSTDLQPIPLDEDSKAVMDAADAIVVETTKGD